MCREQSVLVPCLIRPYAAVINLGGLSVTDAIGQELQELESSQIVV